MPGQLKRSQMGSAGECTDDAQTGFVPSRFLSQKTWN